MKALASVLFVDIDLVLWNPEKELKVYSSTSVGPKSATVESGEGIERLGAARASGAPVQVESVESGEGIESLLIFRHSSPRPSA